MIMVLWLKALHIAALAVWAGGLVVLPLLLARRPAAAEGAELWGLQAFVREAYRAVISPAAFVAVVSGTALVFAREVFEPWFAAKLVVVGLLAVLHLRFGHLVLTVFRPDGHYAPWRQWSSIAAVLSVVAAILGLVLLKPALDVALLPDVLRQPGGLRALAQSLPETIRPMP